MNTIKGTIALVAAAALLATQPGASCVSDGGTTTSSGSGSSPSYPSDTTSDDNRIPGRAEIVKEGRGELNYTADADGTIWVQDVREEETIVSHRIHRGEKLRVVPDEDRVYLEGDRISKADIKRDNAHRVYIERDRRFEDRDRDRDRDANRDRDSGDRDGVTKVPNGADLLGSGKGENIAVWTKREGRIYVYDADAKKVVATARVKSGDRFVFGPNDDQITVNGERVVKRDFSSKTNYRVYQDR